MPTEEYLKVPSDKPNKEVTVVDLEQDFLGSDADFENGGEAVDNNLDTLKVGSSDQILKRAESNITSNTERSSGESKFIIKKK